MRSRTPRALTHQTFAAPARKRERQIFCPQFGALLAKLRGEQSRSAVCRFITEDFGLWLDRSTLLAYERGTVRAPDPAILFALAYHYGVEDVGDLISVLVKERLARPVGAALQIGRSKYDREQRKVAELFGEIGPETKAALLLLLGKVHSAEGPPRSSEPVRRRARR
jgi:transcriptional regulator with XRE-family HTH domain